IFLSKSDGSAAGPFVPGGVPLEGPATVLITVPAFSVVLFLVDGILAFLKNVVPCQCKGVARIGKGWLTAYQRNDAVCVGVNVRRVMLSSMYRSLLA
ncbi:MAG: hypothetical protein REI95_10855, partial [Oxalicibacterium faecigallinarum]|uniref:hypothetical protein n=1 Tax=Oxalicibacterium faecigallinarum TaxID=573741 RepID=UPI0028097D71